MTAIQREHIEAAIKGISRELGKEVPELEEIGYGRLILKYAALIEEGNCLPFDEFELEKLYKSKNIVQNV